MLKLIIFSICLSVNLFFVTCELSTEGESCEWLGLKGKCVPPRVCLTSLDKKSDQPPACADQGGEATICCTDCELVNDTSNFIMSPSSGVFWKDGRKARDACLQYLKDVPHICYQDGYYTGLSRYLNEEKKCHIYTIWGIGGAPPPNSEPPSENPYEALIGFGDNIDTAIWMTTGAIIHEKFILTSAHDHPTTGKTLKFAALGVKNRKGDKKDWQIHTVKNIHQHPEYKTNYRYNDITLLELENTITFNDDVLPACLPDPAEKFNIENAKFSSWKDKNTQFESFLDTANILTVPRLTAQECDAILTEAEAPVPVQYNNLLPEKVKDESQLCYGNKDTCLNVIGGPLAVTTQISRCMNTVIGIHAFGDTCGPAVFTKVVHFVPWIEGIIYP